LAEVDDVWRSLWEANVIAAKAMIPSHSKLMLLM
jgi:hypothetical protein